MLGLAILSSFTISGKESASFYFEIPSILAMNYFFTPFFAFTIYFCFLHSVRHIISLSSELDKKDIKKGLNMFFNKALPLSLITAIIFIIALYFLLDLNQLDEAIFKHLKKKTIVCATRVEPSLHPPGPEKIVSDYGIEP